MIFYGGDDLRVRQQLECEHEWHGPCRDDLSRYNKCLKCYCMDRDISSIDEYWQESKKLDNKRINNEDLAVKAMVSEEENEKLQIENEVMKGKIKKLTSLYKDILFAIDGGIDYKDQYKIEKELREQAERKIVAEKYRWREKCYDALNWRNKYGDERKKVEDLQYEIDSLKSIHDRLMGEIAKYRKDLYNEGEFNMAMVRIHDEIMKENE